MDKTIEVELRGPLSEVEYENASNFLEKNGTFKETKERLLIDYSTFLPDEGIRERKKDIRLRSTNKIPEIIIKLGNWGGTEERKELSLLAKEGEFDKLVQIFAALGYKKGVLAIRKSKVFEYKGIEFALVEVPNHSYYFEAEKMIASDDDIDNVKKEIEGAVDEIGLTLFTDNSFFEYIEKLNREVNDVFDFENYEEDFFKNKFDL